MDIDKILDLIVKGLAVVSALVTAGRDAEPAIKVVVDLVTGAQSESVTDEQLTDTEATLDAMIAEFNLPL